MKQLFAGLGVLILFIALVLGLDYTGFLWDSFMAPKREALHRTVKENSKEYREGHRQSLIRYRFQYMKAEGQAEKDIICSTVRMQFADVPTDGMDYELIQFVNKCQ